MNTQCKICGSDTLPIFKAKVLQKYDVQYFQCNSCEFIQTENPYWIEEAYESAITSLDLGYVMRNLLYREFVSDVIRKLFNKNDRFIDFGGGYGLFVRMMRDLGFNFIRQDNYCENLFALHFDINDAEQKDNFGLLTCFEVFEHLVNPLEEVEKMLQYSQSVLFSTDLQPTSKITSASAWNYIAPEMGQHIAFYTKKSLSVIAEKHGLNLYSDGKNLHLLTNKKWNMNLFKIISFKHRIKNKMKGRYFDSSHSLLEKDVLYVKKMISGEK